MDDWLYPSLCDSASIDFAGLFFVAWGEVLSAPVSRENACLRYVNVDDNHCRVWQIGAPFDYNIHNAIMRENTNEFDEDVVCKARFL